MKKSKIAALVAVVLVAAFILGNSLLPRPESREASLTVQGWITPLLELFMGRGNVTLKFVRKLAHVTEFTAMGLSLGLFFMDKKRWALWGAGLGLAVAAADETLQIFTGRGPAVTDVGIDFCGVLLGLLLCALVRALVRWRKGKKQKRT